MITSPVFAGKRYAVLGLARSGVATVEALLASGAEVVAWDSNEAARNQLLPTRGEGDQPQAGGGGEPQALRPPPSPSTTGFAGGPPPPASRGEELSFADPLTLDLTGFDAVIVSPGVPLNKHPIAAHAASFGVPVIGDIELFAQARASLPPHKVVGITGTNGKSTTTALVKHILETAGVTTLMGGNIGLPILSRDPLPAGGVYVLELSSYQIDLTRTLDCDVAVLLNITPDHLDRYDGFAGYAASKARLFEMQSAVHVAVARARDWWGGEGSDGAGERSGAGRLEVYDDAFYSWQAEPGAIAIFEQPEWPSLQGPHNLENVSAAMSVSYLLGLNAGQIRQGLRTYPGLPHRMERVAERGGVLFVNDSKATNPTSTAPALMAYPAIHWILGGLAKTDDLDACRPGFGHVRVAYTIGSSAQMFAKLLHGQVPVVTEIGTLEEAVRAAAQAARPGETVLLSPACASFDQFRDFEARGDAFRAAVEAL